MDVIYKTAWKEGDTALYIDASDRLFAAKSGDLTWRINNPGLIKHRSRFAKKNGAIGTWEKFAIFSNPLQGSQALKEWLKSSKRQEFDLYALGKHYQPDSSEQFAQNLALSSGIPPKTKVKELSESEFEALLASIEKQCGFVRTGKEEFLLLPKIAAKIECPDGEDFYLIGTEQTLTHGEVINWVISHRLDAVIVRHSNGKNYVRSRPSYRMQILKLTGTKKPGKLDVLARSVGKKIEGQCIWGFINGIRNTKEDAIESSKLISGKAGDEQVFSLKNDQFFQGVKDIGIAVLLKMGVDTPIVKAAVRFFRYLLLISECQGSPCPVVIFAHSQGAAIAEHAIALLNKEEKQKVRIFTFGGWSFVAPGSAHFESHNYASKGDLIPRLGSFSLQYLAMRKQEGLKEGRGIEEIISRLASEDSIRDFGGLDSKILQKYIQERREHYTWEFEKIKNVTILDAIDTWEHSFNSENYQNVVAQIIDKYRKKIASTEVAQHLLAESLV